MSKAVVKISNLTVKRGQKTLLEGINWIINSGENYLLSGTSGSGKTILAKAIAGLTTFSGEVEFNLDKFDKSQVYFVDSWYQFKNLEGMANFYYQQRYTSLQAKDTLSVNAELRNFGSEHQLNFDEVEAFLIAFNFTHLATAQLIELSSGEHKKLQLIKALWLKPAFLVIDQPYAGLDVQARLQLNKLLNNLSLQGVQYLLIGNDDAFPESVNRFAKITNQQLITASLPFDMENIKSIDAADVPDFLKVCPSYSSKNLVKMVNVNISYRDKQVLKNINWEVNAGEKWILQGQNGSGKSTLLSLINGDHPQGYANEFYLFGNRRGSGESVWDIKQHIGLISPEFHWYFNSNSTVWQSIASGFFDSVGLFKSLPYSKSCQVDELINFFDLAPVKDHLLSTLPLGQQRMVLLARTIIKNPELLILDEPCQGLDQQQTQYFNQLVDALCSYGTTLIYVGHYASAWPKTINKRILLENGTVKHAGIILETV